MTVNTAGVGSDVHKFVRICPWLFCSTLKWNDGNDDGEEEPDDNGNDDDKNYEDDATDEDDEKNRWRWSVQAIQC